MTPPEWGTVERRLFDRAKLFDTPYARKVQETLLIGADYNVALDVAAQQFSAHDPSRLALEAFVAGYHVGCSTPPAAAPAEAG